MQARAHGVESGQGAMARAAGLHLHLPPPPPPPPAGRRRRPTLGPSSRVPSVPQEIAPFEEPKIELEQYPTGPHLASRLLYTVRWPGHGGGQAAAASRGGAASMRRPANRPSTLA